MAGSCTPTSYDYDTKARKQVGTGKWVYCNTADKNVNNESCGTGDVVFIDSGFFSCQPKPTIGSAYFSPYIGFESINTCKNIKGFKYTSEVCKSWGDCLTSQSYKIYFNVDPNSSSAVKVNKSGWCKITIPDEKCLKSGGTMSGDSCTCPKRRFDDGACECVNGSNADGTCKSDAPQSETTPQQQSTGGQTGGQSTPSSSYGSESNSQRRQTSSNTKGACTWKTTEIPCNDAACLKTLGPNKKLYCNTNDPEACNTGAIVRSTIGPVQTVYDFKKCTANGWAEIDRTDVKQDCSAKTSAETCYSLDTGGTICYTQSSDSNIVTNIRLCVTSASPQQTPSAESNEAPAPSSESQCAIGEKDKSGYFMCNADTDCGPGKMPNKATKAHCVNVGRACKVCTATECGSGFTVKKVNGKPQGYCVTVQEQGCIDSNGKFARGKCDCGAGTWNPTTNKCDQSNEGPELITISGTIKDQLTGEPLEMATLAYDGTKGVLTDSDGKFELSNIASNTQFSISYVGCTPITKIASELVNVTIELKCDVDLDEFNVIEMDCTHVGEKEDTEQHKTNFKICEIEGCSNKRPCEGDMLPTNAATGECVSAGREGYKICIPITCDDGYTLNTETSLCEPTNVTDDTIPTDNPTNNTVVDAGPSKLEQAEENYKKAKENEQSLANRTLTSATTAATGLGMMAAASARSEQKADADAEQDMAAYLATFKCEYGKGMSTTAGNEEITLPGGNELLNYYQEYK
ncbi:MAG: carboxypeptidase-like regulatory domain-containing protein, partial [Alphaproteobacteria bacterium]|nr:carboxypeptidase-like regulatory domain-containing protein [Alphaproteobacteria bacterium]